MADNLPAAKIKKPSARNMAEGPDKNYYLFTDSAYLFTTSLCAATRPLPSLFSCTM